MLQFLGDRNVIKKEAEILKIRLWKPHKRNSPHVEFENKIDSANTRGDWSHFKITQYWSNIQGKHENKELKNSHIGHCTRTAESANGKAQNIFHGEITLHVAQTVNTEQLQYCVP